MLDSLSIYVFFSLSLQRAGCLAALLATLSVNNGCWLLSTKGEKSTIWNGMAEVSQPAPPLHPLSSHTFDHLPPPPPLSIRPPFCTPTRTHSFTHARTHTHRRVRTHTNTYTVDAQSFIVYTLSHDLSHSLPLPYFYSFLFFSFCLPFLLLLMSLSHGLLTLLATCHFSTFRLCYHQSLQMLHYQQSSCLPPALQTYY